MSTIEDTRTSLAVAEQALAQADKLHELRSKPADKRDDTWEQEVREASNALVDLDREHAARSAAERSAIEAAAWQHAIDNPTPTGGPTAGTRDISGGDVRSPGEQITDSDAYKAAMAAGQRGFGEIEVRNLLSAGSAFGSGSNYLMPVGQPRLANVRQRRLFLRGLIPVQQTGLGSVPYVRELSPATNETGATTVSEGSAKPEVTAQFESADAPIRKIAAWIQVTMEALQDSPTLAGYVNNRLAYMLLVEEEDQLLQGNGTAPNISGILDQTGIQTEGGATNNDPLVDLGTAIGLVENVDGDADGIAMNPGDFWAMQVTRRSTSFDGDGLGEAPFGTPSGTVWGLPVVRTRSLASLTAIVGAWGMGATIHERMGVTIRSTDSHASLFVSNTAVVLAEERVGLEVARPDWFVNVTIDITA